ncbi:hypothetical protein [Methylocella sp.]|uniref:hypothetical protein n=1 Tax=Methylocella sp. TaxID=1978226 RepID=UPI003783288F
MKPLPQPASAGKFDIAKNAKFLQDRAVHERGPVSDRRFFARFPERLHYVWFADVAEAALVPPPPPGKAIFVAIHQIAPGVRARKFLARTRRSILIA